MFSLVSWRVNHYSSNKVVQRVQVGEEGGQWEKGTKSLHSWSQAWVSLDLCPAATLRVCHWPPDCTRGSTHRWGVSSMIAWAFSMNSLVQVFLSVQCAELCLQALDRPDLHFEGAGNGPVVITWMGREHELYSGACRIPLVEHCVTFRHDRRLLSILGSVHICPTSRWSAIKKENRFSLNGNGIMSAFLGRQCYRSTIYIYIYIYVVSLGSKSLSKPIWIKPADCFFFKIFKWKR